MHKIIMMFIGLLFAACNESYTPKPRGFYGIDLPEKNTELVNLIVHSTLNMEVMLSWKLERNIVGLISHTPNSMALYT